MAQLAAMPSQGTLSGKAKLDEVTSLLEKLKVDLKEHNLDPKQRDATLEQLKVYGRDPTNADPIFTSEGLKTLGRTAFGSDSKTTAREALRCIANALLLKESARQRLIDLGFDDQIFERLDSDADDDEFLISRVAFLATYKTNFDADRLIEEHRAGEKLTSNVARHAAAYKARLDSGSAIIGSSMEEMALIETLKVVFGLSHGFKKHASSFAAVVPHVLEILAIRPRTANDPLDTMTGQLINSLINFDLDANIIFPHDDPKFVDNLIDLLDTSTKRYDDNSLNSSATPLVAVLRKFYEVAPTTMKAHMQKRLLPTEEERDKPLGQSDTFASKLLQLSVSALAPQLRDNVSSLLFEISDKDAEKFVNHVGYGFASGYLFQNDISLSERTLGAASRSQTSSSRPVNPITGQRLDAEPSVNMPQMSQEEREREAERLFVLFERQVDTLLVSC